MAEKNITRTVKTPSGKEIDIVVPASWDAGKVRSMLLQKRPDLFQPARPGMPAPPTVEMKESMAPKIARATTEALPLIGGMGGAIAGAPAFGGGALVGGALGAAGGEAAHQALNRWMLGDDPGSIKQQLTKVGMAGAIGALSEIPGALAVTSGNRVLARIAVSKSPSEVGNAVKALFENAPVGFSKQGLLRDLNISARKLSDSLGGSLAGTNTVPLDNALRTARLEARVADSELPKTSVKLERIIKAAKLNAGIRGGDVTPSELWKFMKQLQKPGYTGAPGPVQQVLKNLVQRAYQGSGQELRTIAPGVDVPLRQLTNLHAAENAIKVYKPTRFGATAAAAALHPRTSAVISPVVTGAAVAGAEKAKKVISGTGKEIIE